MEFIFGVVKRLIHLYGVNADVKLGNGKDTEFGMVFHRGI